MKPMIDHENAVYDHIHSLRPHSHLTTTFMTPTKYSLARNTRHTFFTGSLVSATHVGFCTRVEHFRYLETKKTPTHTHQHKKNTHQNPHMQQQQQHTPMGTIIGHEPHPPTCVLVGWVFLSF